MSDEDWAILSQLMYDIYETNNETSLIEVRKLLKSLNFSRYAVNLAYKEVFNRCSIYDEEDCSIDYEDSSYGPVLNMYGL